jgi:hypothetical protein
LFGLVDRADEKTDLDGQELDVGEIDLDVADNDEALVEHAIQNVDKAIAARRGYQVCQAVVSVRLVAVLA